jgi:hypothetical protein
MLHILLIRSKMFVVMKLRFLDHRNYLSLLPPVRGLPSARVLDTYLGDEVNDKKGDHCGSIDALIRHNERTINMSRSSKRLKESPIEVAVIYHAEKRTVDLQAIVRPHPLTGSAKLHTLLEFENGITWKTVVPLQYLLKGWGDANRGYQCYVHSISQHITQVMSFADMIERQEDGSSDYSYAGITSRNWLHRFREHMSEAGRGSRKTFHRAWRDFMGVPDVHFISQLGPINLTKDDAMNWEEANVDNLGPNRLNMIAGGYKGLQQLHELGIIGRKDISLEEREIAIAEYLRRNPKKGIPHPFMAERWKDDEHFRKVMEANPKTLSEHQVRMIRELDKEGHSVEEITETVDARNEMQVKNVICG